MSSDDQTTYILAPFVKIKFIQDELVFGFGSMCSVISREYYDVQDALLNSAMYLLKPTCLNDLKSTLISKYHVTEALTDKTIDFLLDGNYIVKSAKLPEKQFRFSRNWQYYLMNGADPSAVQDNLKNSHVCFIGCGGIGSLMATALAANGVGKITLIDDDVIEESNLTRQIIFTENDIGQHKVDVLKQAILSRNSNVEIVSIKEKISGENIQSIIPRCELIILSGDEPANISDIVEQYCKEHSQPYMVVGYITDYPYWSLYRDFDKHSQSFSVNSKKNHGSNNDILSNSVVKPEYLDCVDAINRRSSVPSVAHVNFISVGLALNDALMFLGQYNTPHSLNTNISLILDELRFFKNESAITNQAKSQQSMEMQQ